MTKTIVVLGFALLFIFPMTSNAQASEKKGKFSFAWGYNRGWYSDSDITFTGDNYDFTLADVQAKDRQSKLDWDPYIKINKLTIPQYNVRVGYFINDKYSVMLGWDHMKYVMVQDQTASISGKISNTDPRYDGVYDDDAIVLTPAFLTFEHTDGLNYANVELHRQDRLYTKGKISINLATGAGAGILYPRTNIGLMDIGRADQWHLSGYGFSALAGVNVTAYDRFFVQSEMKGGFINMPNILSTYHKADKAKQHFFFSQWNVTFGAYFSVGKK